MSSSAIVPVSPVEASASVGRPIANRKISTASEKVKEFFQSIQCHLHHNRVDEFLKKIPYPPHKLVPLCIDLAITAYVPIAEEISQKLPSINLGFATVQGVVSLRGIGTKITKSLQALKEKEMITARLKEAQSELQQTLHPAARAQLEIEIEGLLKHIGTCNSKIFSVTQIPALVTNMASSGLAGVDFIAKKVGIVSQSVLAGIKTASSIAGAATGGFAILLGGIESFLGIRDAVRAYKQKKLVDAKLEEFAQFSHSEKDIPSDIWKTVRAARGLQLGREDLKANKNFQMSVLRACGGSLATVAGALGIAAAFTSGVAATGIAIASLVVGMVGAGLSIHSYLQRRRLKSEMASLKITNERMKELISYIKSPLCTDEQKKEIARALDIDITKFMAPDIHLLHEFRKLLCTEEDTKELASYLCTGKSSENQKVKFSLLFDKPVSIIHDRQVFLEKVLKDCFKKKRQRVNKLDIRALSDYFRARKPTLPTKKRAAQILGVSVSQLGNSQKVLENILLERRIHLQKTPEDQQQKDPSKTPPESQSQVK